MLKRAFKTKQTGYTLIEFVISTALSLSAILLILTLYVTTFSIDTKTIRFSRLADEVNAIKVLLADDIKRAGYTATAETIITEEIEDNDPSRCLVEPQGCSDENFRKILTGRYDTDEPVDSCILFAYDNKDQENGSFEDGTGVGEDSEAYGYRLKDEILQTRKGGNGCAESDWESLTNTNFIKITSLEFLCLVETLDPDDGTKVDDITQDEDGVQTAAVADGINDVEPCAAANMPPPVISATSVVVSVKISFTAELAEDDSISLSSEETVMVRNAIYN